MIPSSPPVRRVPMTVAQLRTARSLLSIGGAVYGPPATPGAPVRVGTPDGGRLLYADGTYGPRIPEDTADAIVHAQDLARQAAL